jgi:hypothetical protein
MVWIGRLEEVIGHGRRRVAVRFRAGGGGSASILIEGWRRWLLLLLVVRLLRIAIWIVRHLCSDLSHVTPGGSCSRTGSSGVVDVDGLKKKQKVGESEAGP